MISRRRLLTSGSALVAVAGLYTGTRFATGDAQSAIAEVVRHYFKDRALHPDAPDAFATDYAPLSEWRWQQEAMRAAHAYFLPAVRAALPENKRLRLDQIDRAIVSEFILASDYEPQSDDASQPLEYIGLETDRLCNPFAQMRLE